MSDSAYIEWGDVTITEETDSLNYGDGSMIEFSSSWIAEFEGHICNTGLDDTTSRPVISFSRSGPTAEAAAQNFVKAAAAQGWEVR